MPCFKNFSRAKIFHFVIGFIIFLIILLATFQAGRFVGFHQAGFSGRLGDNYYRMMGGRGFWSDDLPSSHGAVGKIIKINLPTLVVVGPDNLEKIIKVSEKTLVHRFHEAIKVSDLKVGDFIVTLGEADKTLQIEAKLIRLLP
jgi:hypothetical protein